VSKLILFVYVSEVGGPTMAASFMGSKKGDVSASCEKLFAGETIVAPEVKEAALAWVPEAMRFRVIAASETEDDQPPVEGESNDEAEMLEPGDEQPVEAAEPIDA
jgi:ParB family chromosome partitioning protein